MVSSACDKNGLVNKKRQQHIAQKTFVRGRYKNQSTKNTYPLCKYRNSTALCISNSSSATCSTHSMRVFRLKPSTAENTHKHCTSRKDQNKGVKACV